MINEKLYLKDGTLLLNSYNRVVHGERGDYIEFEKEHLTLSLIPHFNNRDIDELLQL